ncbi:type VII secretion protein EssC [Paenibacillus andongensis]|uniref:type VII secretion protein EssC n=1 Tax=Paenibacillus andongensis TaxID=2975482 RepID=UPI0021BA493E|nr:type VII secretion protein EssC [Paenibacillus andongensis]
MSDFLVAICIDNIVKELKLSTLLSKQTGSVLDREFLDSSVDLLLPFYKSDQSWMVGIADRSKAIITVNSEEVSEKIIEHADYITVKDVENDIQYSLLILSLEKHALEFHKYYLENNKNIFIGRLPESDIYFNINNMISRKHAALRVEANGDTYIEDLSGKTGVYVNGQRMNSAKLKIGDIVFIIGLKIVYMGGYIAVSSNIAGATLQPFLQPNIAEPLAESKTRNTFYTRSPRIMKTLESGVFEIDAPPPIQKSRRMPLIFTLGPSLTMVIAMLASLGFTIARASSGSSIAMSLTMTVSMMIGAILWPTLMNRYQKRLELADENYRQKRYAQYIEQQKAILDDKYQRNSRILQETHFPGPNQIYNIMKNKESERRLWERKPSDSDFLEVRLGKGERDFEVQVTFPKQGFMLDEDPLINEPAKLAQKYAKLHDAPITVSLLDERTVGLIGDREKIMNNMKCMALHLAGLHAYDEVKMVFVYNEFESAHFEWTKELPHVWSTNRNIRYVATNKNEVHQLFNAIDEAVKEREQGSSRDSRSNGLLKPHFVVFIADEKLVDNEPLMRYIANPHNVVSISGVFIYGGISKLPKDCEVIIQNDDSECGIYYKNKLNNRLMKFTADEVRNEDLVDFSQRLSTVSVKTESMNLSVPERVSFLGMYKAGNIEELNIERFWSENLSYQSLAAPIGIKAGGELFSLDIHENYHGCHGLVAGMTGSGKSEFLQTYIISAAINFHPHDLSFVLIDYKGGGMANIFDGMPHIAGKITNLSGSQLNRSLISIKAELNQRQLLFNQYGINHIDKYQKLYKEGKASIPLPHLAIISDEFAQLKTQQPDFMRELIDVAQIGRSLGIHLILATQKPSGVVDDQIWSNSKFRVCLKVLDKYDSNEMIKKPDAAMIKLPGRCYVQVGYDEIFEFVQSGYSGSEYVPVDGYIDEEDRTVSLINNTATPLHVAKEEMKGRKTGKSQLESLIDKVIEIAARNEIEPIRLWMEPLQEEIALSEIEGFGAYGFNGREWQESDKHLEATIGLADFPRKQKQLPLTVNLMKDGHIVVYGTSGMGKTTFVQTLLYSLAYTYSPDDIHMYVFDFGGRTLGYFSELPHCGGVFYADDEDRVEDTVNGLLELMEQRKRLFSENNVGSFDGYISATKKKLPAVVLVVDNYSVLKERFYRLEDNIVKLASNGKTYGIYLIITGNSKGAVFYKVTEHVSNFVTLRLNDSMHYREVLNTSVPLDLDHVRGRGLTVVGEVIEFQTALVAKKNNEIELVSYIREQIARMSASWTGEEAALDGVHEAVAYVAAASEAKASKQKPQSASLRSDTNHALPLIEIDEHALYVGNSPRNNAPKGLALKDLHTFFIGGQEETGKTAMLKSLITDMNQYVGRQVMFIDRDNQELQSFCEEARVDRYMSLASEVDDFIKELAAIVKERSTEYEVLRTNVETEDDVYGFMLKYQKQFIFINGFSDFYDMISDDAADKLDRLIPICKGLNIYFITMDNFAELKEYAPTPLYLHLVKAEKGIVMGGSVSKQPIFTFENMNQQDRNKVLPAGHGFLFDNNKFEVITMPY